MYCVFGMLKIFKSKAGYPARLALTLLKVLPMTETTKMLVKCRYSDNLTRFLRILSVLIVCSKDMKIHQQMTASNTDNGTEAIICLRFTSAFT